VKRLGYAGQRQVREAVSADLDPWRSRQHLQASLVQHLSRRREMGHSRHRGQQLIALARSQAMESEQRRILLLAKRPRRRSLVPVDMRAERCQLRSRNRPGAIGEGHQIVPPNRLLVAEHPGRYEDQRRTLLAFQDRQCRVEIVRPPIVEGDEQWARRQGFQCAIALTQIGQSDRAIVALEEAQALGKQIRFDRVVGFGSAPATIAARQDAMKHGDRKGLGVVPTVPQPQQPRFIEGSTRERFDARHRSWFRTCIRCRSA
jgi:hypothetical protein